MASGTEEGGGGEHSGAGSRQQQARRGKGKARAASVRERTPTRMSACVRPLDTKNCSPALLRRPTCIMLLRVLSCTFWNWPASLNGLPLFSASAIISALRLVTCILKRTASFFSVWPWSLKSSMRAVHTRRNMESAAVRLKPKAATMATATNTGISADGLSTVPSTIQ